MKSLSIPEVNHGNAAYYNLRDDNGNLVLADVTQEPWFSNNKRVAKIMRDTYASTDRPLFVTKGPDNA